MSKKNFLNKKGTAVIITVILVLAGFLIGGVRPLSGLRNEAAAGFFSGTEIIAGTVLTFDISEDLHSYSAWSANLVTVAERHVRGSQAAEEVREARARLNALLEDASGSTDRFGELFFAYNTLLVSVILLAAELDAQNVDASEYGSILEELGRAETRITRQSSIFNESVEEFNETLGRFPAALFRITGLVRPLDLFGRVLL